MSSLKAEKPAGTQPAAAPAKKETVKLTSCLTKAAPASKPAPKVAEQKPREPKKKVSGSKPAAK